MVDRRVDFLHKQVDVRDWSDFSEEKSTRKDSADIFSLFAWSIGELRAK